MSHDAFISYSRKDRAFAVRLQKALENYVPPRDLPLPHRRLDVFRDEEDFTGAEYYQSVDRHLHESGKLIVLCSPAARGSQFVNDEIRRFASAKGPERIIALLVAGIPNNEATPEQSALIAFPDALCEVMEMPLAADYRGFDPGRSRVDRGVYEGSWYTTLANLYDISRSQIEQRERKRRARRRLIAVSTAAASIVVLAGLSFIAWDRWQEAERQENESAARLLANRADSNESTELSQGLRVRALLAAESLRKARTNEGYRAWRRATLLMPPILANMQTDALFIKMVFTPDSKRLFALCGERHIHVLSVPDLRELHKLQASETAFELAIDAKGEQALAYQANDESVELFEIGSGSRRTVPLPATFRLASFNPAGEAIVASLTNLWVIDVASDQVASRATFPASTSDVVMSPDGATVLARSDKVLGAYDTESGMLRWQVRASDDEEWRVAVFSGDGQSLMIKGARSALIVSAASGETIKSIPLKPGSDGRLVLLNGEKYALGNEVYAVGERLRRTLPFRKPSESSRLPIASLSGRYLAGNLQSHEGDFAIVDVSREVVSTHKAEADRYVTLKQGLVTKAATFSPDSEMLAVSSDAQDYGRHPGELQLVSLKRERWSPIIPDRSSTGDFAVIPPDAHVVVKKETPSVRIFDSGGALLEGAGTGTFFSASGRFVARLESGKQWVITDIANKREITVPDNGSPIEFSPDERRVLVFPNIYTLDNPGSPQTLAATQPLYKTWSYPGANLVIGLYGDQINQGAKGGSVLFDWATGKVSTGPGSVYSLYAVSPDGRQFASYDYDAIFLWTVGNSKPTVRSAEPTKVDSDKHLYFSPDGALLAMASCTNTSLFDTRTLKLSFQIPMEGCFAGFSRDEKYVVSRWWLAGFPEPTRHPITLEGVLEETCAKVHTNLTAQEWEKLDATAFAVATCPERAPSLQVKAGPSK
jgi:WD40 repeat protein